MGATGKKVTSGTTSLPPIADTIPDKGETSEHLIDEVEYDKSRKYHTFEGEVQDPWDYYGTGQDTIDFFNENSNFDEVIKTMDKDEKQAFFTWAQGYWMDGTMYKDFKDLSPKDKKMVKTYDKIIDQITLKEGITVTRRATPELLGLPKHSKPTLEQLNALRGETIACKANMSCGAAPHGLTIGHAAEKPIEYVIHIAEGTTGAGMWIGDHRINHWGSKQREYMTNRDSVYAIGRTTEGYDKKTGMQVYRVHLYYMGRTEHTY